MTPTNWTMEKAREAVGAKAKLVTGEISEAMQKLWEFICVRKMAYVLTFDVTHPYSRRVLKDLAKFCRAGKTTFHVDPRAHALLEGRREVWLRIQEHLNLTEQQLLALYGED